MRWSLLILPLALLVWFVLRHLSLQADAEPLSMADCSSGEAQLSPRGDAFTTSRGNLRVDVWDTSSLRRIGTLAATDADWSPDGTRLMVATDHRLQLVDATRVTVTKSFAVGDDWPKLVGWTADQRRFWFLERQRLRELDLETGVVGVPELAILLREKMFLMNGYRCLFDCPEGLGIFNARLGPQGDLAFVWLGDDYNLRRFVATPTHEGLEVIELDASAWDEWHRPQWSRDGNRVLFTQAWADRWTAFASRRLWYPNDACLAADGNVHDSVDGERVLSWIGGDVIVERDPDLVRLRADGTLRRRARYRPYDPKAFVREGINYVLWGKKEGLQIRF